MKSLIATVSILLLLSPLTVGAQTRSRRTTTTTQRRRAPATSSNSRLSATQLNAARIRLADQIKNLTLFVYVYGRFSKDLELTSAQGESAEVTQRTKEELLRNLRQISSNLDQLEAYFRFTAGLEQASQRLQGVSRRAAEAESAAAANQYDRAGRTLVEVVRQLTDAMTEM